MEERKVLGTWRAPCAPPRDLRLEGQYTRLEPLTAKNHATVLFREFDSHDAVWDYMPYGPFPSVDAYKRWMHDNTRDDNLLFLAIYDKDRGQFGGQAAFLRITPAMGCIELGHIALSPALQRTRAATEAFFLMMNWAFSAGYRRFEWKCDALNTRSRRAAQRLGLSFEGIFRQHMVIKGRNRDTAWFAATDSDWSGLQQAFAAWLSSSNFTSTTIQRESLSDLTRHVRVTSDPIV